MHLANQRPRKPDKLSQDAHNQTSYLRIQWENTLDKRGLQNPGGNENKEQHTENEEQRARAEGNVRSRAGIRAYELPMLQEARNQA